MGYLDLPLSVRLYVRKCKYLRTSVRLNFLSLTSIGLKQSDTKFITQMQPSIHTKQAKFVNMPKITLFVLKLPSNIMEINGGYTKITN